MAGWAPILVLLAAAPPRDVGPPGAMAVGPADDAGASAALATVAAGTHDRLAIVPGRARLMRLLADATFTRPGAGGSAVPACVADTCQPRVSVPGYDRPVSMRGKRTELAVQLLDRARIEPLATAVWFLAATGVRLDYTPPQLEGGLETGRAGWGHMQLLLRWRIDALNAPVWPVRHR